MSDMVYVESIEDDIHNLLLGLKGLSRTQLTRAEMRRIVTALQTLNRTAQPLLTTYLTSLRSIKPA